MRPPQALLHPVLLLGLVCSACGDRPERLEKGSPASSMPAAAPVSSEARFEGRLVLEGAAEGSAAEGSAAEGSEGAAVFLSARRIGQRLPTLSHKYELRDAAWSKEGEKRVLKFQLTDLDNMGGFGAPMAAEMEIEARYDPDGLIDPRPGADETGVVRATVPTTPGAKGIEVVVRLGASK